MDLIDRYVLEVGRHLPAGSRADVEAELRSLLADSLEERANAAGRPPDDAMAADLLREFGAPSRVASRYLPGPQCLIGPRLYPTFVTVLKVGTVVYVAAAFVATILRVLLHGGAEDGVSAVTAQAGGRLLSGFLLNFGLLVLVFAVVDRLIAQRQGREAAWDPARLPVPNDRDRVSYVGRISMLYLLAALILVFDFYPEWVGVVSIRDGDVLLTPLLAAGFERYLPFLNVLWGLSFVLSLVVLRQGRWRKPTRWAEFGLELSGAVLLVAILAGPPVFHFDALVKLVLEVFLLVSLVRAGFQLYRLLRP